MTNSSDRECHSSDKGTTRLWLLILCRVGLGLTGLLLVGLGLGTWRLWRFIQEDLAPLAQKSVKNTLNRPVELGDVKQFSLQGVQFGASRIPATSDDPANATVESVDVGFDVWSLLWSRRLNLHVTLNNPVLYVAQDIQGRWLVTKINPPGKPGAIETNLNSLGFRNGKLTLLPSPQGNQAILKTRSLKSLPKTGQPLNFVNVNGNIRFQDRGRRLQLDVNAKPVQGKKLVVRGEIIPRNLNSQLQIQGEGISARDVSNLIPLPVELPKGQAWGNLKVEYQQGQTPLLFGNVRVKDLQVEIPRVPRPFSKGEGNIGFDGTALIFQNARSSYGKVRFTANGVIDRQTGFRLNGRTDVLSAASLQETLNLKLPLAVKGNLQGNLQFRGELEDPVLRGTATTVKTARVDKVDIKSAQTKFEFTPSTGIVQFRDIQAVPVVGGKITGSGRVRLINNPQVGFNLVANNIPGDAIANVYGIKPDFQVGTMAGVAQLTGTPERVTTTVRWQAPQAAYPGTGTAIVNPDRSVDFRDIALRVAGGDVKAVGTWDNDQWQFVANTNGVRVLPFLNPDQLENINLAHLGKSTVNGQFAATGTTAPFQIDRIDGNGGGLRLGGGNVPISTIRFAGSAFQADFRAAQVRLSQVLKQSHQVLQNPLNGKFQIAGDLNNFSLQALQGTGEAVLPVGGGTIAVNNIQLNDGKYRAKVNFNRNSLRALAPMPGQVRGKLSGTFLARGTVDSFEIPAIQAQGQARIDMGGGTITANNFVLANGRYRTNAIARNIPVQQFTSIPPELGGRLNGKFAVAGDATNIQLENSLLTGEGQLSLAGGIIASNNFKLAQGGYQADLNIQNIDLQRLDSQLTGEFAGNLQVVGNVSQLNAANAQAVGTVAFSQGLGGLNRPIQATVGWNGEKLIVQRATGKGFTGQGYIFANGKVEGIPEITQIQLDVDARDYALNQLPAKLPNNMALMGVADFRGQVTGTLPTPNLIGSLGVRNLKVGDFAFEPLLKGNLRSQRGQGLQLDVTGESDRIALKLDDNNNPQSFSLRWEQARAIGKYQGNTLYTQVENFPLAVLNLTPPANPYTGGGKISGNLDGDLQINQNTLATSGKIAINQPQAGRISGDRLTANLSYANGKLTLADSSLQKGDSNYAFVGSIEPGSDIPRIQGKISVRQGNIQDILKTLQIFDINDFTRGLNPPSYGSATDLETVQPVGVAQKPLLQKIQRYSEIQALLDLQEQARLDASPIPELVDLQGIFNSDITLDTSNPQNYKAQFQFYGNDFAWGRVNEPSRYYQAEKVIVEGQFADNLLTLRPLRIESQNRLIAFNGSLGLKEQLGQLTVNNFPLSILGNFVRLPVGLSGNLNATANISGNIFDPQATGDISVSDGTLNQKGVESASAGFNYSNGKLSFGSQIEVAESKPVTIKGTIPYRLPFALVPPDSNDISLNVKVENEGLAVINLLTNQLAYESGAGSVDVKVAGTIDKPIVEGIASLDGATFSAQALPGEITDVIGQIKFDFDRIIVDSLGGNFSKGRIEAKGEIPISTPLNTGNSSENPLSVNLDRLALNLKGLYQGGISGNLVIAGSALDPILGGNLELSNGQFLLADSTTTNTPPQGKNIPSQLQDSFPGSQNPLIAQAENPTRFNDLLITLGNNLEIATPPIFSFKATGQLKLNGSLADPIPVGEIRLRDGGVNLFTTQLSLARGYKHTATFRENQPRDPELDIQLFAKVLDVVQSSDLSRFNSGTLGRLESIRIEANIQGPASQLNENLELRSTPARSQNEIVALLGGGFVDPQGEGDSTLGLINIAGSAVLNNFQSAFSEIGTAFGLSEFRIFPTILSEDPEAGRNSSSLELAAEAGVDINPKFSVSALKILTADDPFQWGLNYRINREFRLRGSTNFFDDNRAVVEFERRF